MRSPALRLVTVLKLPMPGLRKAGGHDTHVSLLHQPIPR